jgi:hypothetical protein
MDHLKKKFEAKYFLFALPSLWTINLATHLMQSRFARGPQLRVRVISVISKLCFVASGSVLSRVMSSAVQCLVYLFSLVYSC